MVQKQPETPSEIIKAARDKSDLTVEELTDRVGITERYLYRIENEGKIPTFEVLKKIVRELAIDLCHSLVLLDLERVVGKVGDVGGVQRDDLFKLRFRTALVGGEQVIERRHP